MKNLLNNCTCTELWVSPSNWKTISGKKAIEANWYVQCDFFDPNFSEKYPKGFPFRKKLNKFKTVDQRRAAVRLYLEEIPKLLEEKGFNPITKSYMVSDLNVYDPSTLSPDSLFLDALDLAFKNLKIAKSTSDDIKYMLPKVKSAVSILKYDELKISDVKRKHIRFTLDKIEETEKIFSAHKFNKYRGYLSILFKELVECEAVEDDVVLGIKKRVHETKLRLTLTNKERVLVNDYLKNNFVDFWRFTLIFFHSGGRISELLQVKAEDVNLAEQKYKVLIKKGKQYKWVERVIKDVALDLWKKSLYGARPSDYIFSEGLQPGPSSIRREQISRRWNMHVKEKLGIKADFYSLKHTNLDETVALLSMKDAAAMANHKSTSMLEKHYAVGEQSRQFARLKQVNNNFA